MNRQSAHYPILTKPLINYIRRYNLFGFSKKRQEIIIKHMKGVEEHNRRIRVNGNKDGTLSHFK